MENPSEPDTPTHVKTDASDIGNRPPKADAAPIHLWHPYLDLLKALAMFLVCCYHFALTGDIAFTEGMAALTMARRLLFGVNSICVPLFFMVSGALLLNRPLDVKRHYRRSGALLLQYYFWRAVTILSVLLCMGRELSDIRKTIWINDVFLLGNTLGTNPLHLWFIPTLLAIYLLVPLLEKTARDGFGPLYVLMGALLVFLFVPDDMNALTLTVPRLAFLNFGGLYRLNPFGEPAGAMLFYFLLGGALHRYYERIRRVPYYVLLLLFLAGAGLLFGKWLLLSRATDTTWDSVFGGYSSVPTILMAVAVFIAAAKLPEKRAKCRTPLRRVVGFVSRNTLNIYYLHFILLYACQPYLEAAIPYRNMPVNIVKSVVTVLLCAGIAELCKRIPVVRRTLR